jgi:hypothetical protein
MHHLEYLQKSLAELMANQNNKLRFECNEQMTSALRSGTTIEAIKFLHLVYIGLSLTDTRAIIEGVRNEGKTFGDMLLNVSIINSKKG